jgi:predicted transport protein
MGDDSRTQPFQRRPALALFDVREQTLEKLAAKDFENEARLHALFDANLETILGVRFVEAEYPIPDGRIETLGLDEHNVPVVIEYKKGQDPGAIIQGLFYLNWVSGNRKAFQAIVHQALGQGIAVNWSAPPRLVVIAKDFNVRELASLGLMWASVELKRYSYYGHLLQVDDVTPLKLRSKSSAKGGTEPEAEPPEYTIEQLLKKPEPAVGDLFLKVRARILTLPQVWEKVGSYYCDYRTTSTFASPNVQKKRLCIYIKMGEHPIDDPNGITELKDFGFGRLNTRFYLQPGDDINYAMRLIRQAYEYVGV